jgi:hypothetical protein
MVRRSLLAMMVLFGATACSDAEGIGVVAQRLDLSARNQYGGVLWLPDGMQLIWVHVAEDPDAVWYITADNQDLRKLNLEADARCRRVDFRAPSVLPDGRLGLIKRCYSRWPDRPTPLGDESYLIAYDWTTGAVEQVVAGPLPNSDLSSQYTWNPQMTRGVQEFSSLDGTLFWISPAGTEPMTVTVSDGRRSWSLDENYVAIRDRLEPKDTGVARAPAWSPDGTQIAFLSTLDSIGRGGIHRTSGAWGLYLMDPVELQPRRLLDGIYDPTVMRWAPDGQWLAFLGQAGRSRQRGLWLFSPTLNQLRLVAAGRVTGLAWSPDSGAIAAALCADQFCQEREIWQYDVSAITQSQ